MVARFAPLLTAAGLVFATLVVAQTSPAPLKGYLTPDTTPQTLRILPPPPKAGSGREADDQAIFNATRALKGDPRWSLATSDADLSPRAGLFACAIGMTLDETNAPALQRLLGR